MICEVSTIDPTTDEDIDTYLTSSAADARAHATHMRLSHPDATVRVFAASEDVKRVWGPLVVREDEALRRILVRNLAGHFVRGYDA